MSTARTAALLVGAFVVGYGAGYELGYWDGYGTARVRLPDEETSLWRTKPRRRL